MSTLPSLPAVLPTTGPLLSYTLPLLFASIVLTFAGTFLTLDRSRQFAPAYDAIVPGSFDKPSRPRAKSFFLLGGGAGGLASGWAFGVHFTTFMSLLVPAVRGTKQIGPKSFIAVWLISTVLTTYLAGRWRYATITMSGITGGTLFSLMLSMLLHPSLITRLVLTAVFMPLILLLCLLPFPKVQYAVLRIANSSAGAAGIVISIALLTHEPNWSNIWERYWVADGNGWGSGKEKGLSAACCIFLVVGMLCDFFLKKKFGECPDQKWDSYLSRYTRNLPDRAGTFNPPRSLFDKILGKGETSKDSKDIIFPDDAAREDSKLAPPPAYDFPDFEHRSSTAYLKKGRSQSAKSQRFAARTKSAANGRKREAIKFRPIGESDLSSDSDSDGEGKQTKLNSVAPQRPWLKSKTSVASTTATLVNEDIDYDKDLEALKKTRKKGFGDKEIPDYSDGEDVTSNGSAPTTPVRSSYRNSQAQDGKEWSPKFIQEHRRNSNSHSPRNSNNGSVASGSRTSSRTSVPQVPTPSSAGFKAVPATPSLIRAIDRVQMAQREAYGPPTPSANDGLPRLNEEEDDDTVEERDIVALPTLSKQQHSNSASPASSSPKQDEHKPHGGWQSFWRDVEKKNRADRESRDRQSQPQQHQQHQHRS